MTEKLKIHSSSIDKALANKDFNSLLKLFANNSFSCTELLVFYKRNEQVLSSQNFWNSELPHFHLQGILETDLKVTFLQLYFSNALFCNHELNKHLLVLAKADYIKHYKLWKAFEYSNFFDSVKQISKSNTELERIVKEFEIIIKAQNRIEVEQKEDEQYFLQFTFDEVALAFTLFYYEFKQHDQILGNKSFQTKIEVALVDEMDRILSLFKGKPNLTFQFKSNDELQTLYQRNEAPHHILGKKGLHVPPEPKYELLYSLINRLIDRNGRRGQIQLYICGYADFESVILNPAPLRTNINYKIFSINDIKSVPEELYFSKNIADRDKNAPKSRTDISSKLETLKYYGVPELIQINGNSIEIKKVLQLLRHFSVYKGPVERTIFPDKSFYVTNQGDKLFVELFGSNESITLFDFEKLYRGIATYFKWTELETKAILSFLTFDISHQNLPINWESSPFIKCNNHVMWLGSFLRDRRWDNILLNKLKKEPAYNKLVNTFSKNCELRVEELLNSKSFKTLSGLKFRSSNGQSGDFDVLAFRDNYLFVCEVKTGGRSNEFFHAAYSETVRLEGCAAEQLEKAIFNIKDDWENIKTILKIPKELLLDSVKIIPLIVTDYFEGDLQLYKSAYRKVSFLELDVILKNKKQDLMQLYDFIKSNTDSHNPERNRDRSIISNWDLWEGKKELDVETIIRNIEQNTIWKEIEMIWKFEEESCLIYY